MADSSSSALGLDSMIAHLVYEKLATQNHATWKAQVVTTMRGARLQGYLTGQTAKPAAKLEAKDSDKTIKVVNPAFVDWRAAYQQVLSFLLASVSKDVLIQIATKQTTSHAWSSIEAMFSSQTRAHAMNMRLALATTPKGGMTVAKYIARMRSLGDEMAAAGRQLEDDELVEYILIGLNEEYNSFVSIVLA
jgi:hypothetical protein